ncbi:MAG: ATP-dependent DNA helicase RecG, partial [Proteobacteria bacterium SW_6_67_9]
MPSSSSTSETGADTRAWSAPAQTPALTTLAGVGPRMAERLERLGLRTVADALFHLPLRYEDRTQVWPIGQLGPGNEALIDAEIEHAQVVQRRRRALVAIVHDGTGTLTLRWFHFGARQREQLVAGRRIRLYGELRHGPDGPEIVHPEYRLYQAGRAPPVEDALTPVYPATEGLGQSTLRRITGAALDWLTRSGGLADLAATATPAGWPDLASALRTVHRPPPDVDVAGLLAGTHPACRRLAFEELLAHHVSLRRLRERARSFDAPVLAGDSRLTGALRAGLGFALTGAQERVVGDVSDDLARGQPMLRLIQGDVGSGKTVVAALAALQALEAGYQAAIMAPTEVLAEQHHRSFSQWLEPLGIEVGWLTGRLTAAARRRSAAGP